MKKFLLTIALITMYQLGVSATDYVFSNGQTYAIGENYIHSSDGSFAYYDDNTALDNEGNIYMRSGDAIFSNGGDIFIDNPDGMDIDVEDLMLNEMMDF